MRAAGAQSATRAQQQVRQLVAALKAEQGRHQEALQAVRESGRVAGRREGMEEVAALQRELSALEAALAAERESAQRAKVTAVRDVAKRVRAEAEVARADACAAVRAEVTEEMQARLAAEVARQVSNCVKQRDAAHTGRLAEQARQFDEEARALKQKHSLQLAQVAEQL
eukprot:5588773-Pleurochrysis_carterae.AAC.1